MMLSPCRQGPAGCRVAEQHRSSAPGLRWWRDAWGSVHDAWRPDIVMEIISIHMQISASVVVEVSSCVIT